MDSGVARKGGGSAGSTSMASPARTVWEARLGRPGPSTPPDRIHSSTPGRLDWGKRPRGSPAHEPRRGPDPLLHAGAAERGKALMEQLVEPLGSVLRGRGEAERRNHASDRAPLGVVVSDAAGASAGAGEYTERFP